MLKHVLVFVGFLSTPLVWGAETNAPSLSFGNGVEFKDPGKNYQLNLRFRLQNLASFASATSPTQDSQYSALIRRARMRLSGWAVSPDLLFTLQLSFSRNDMDWDTTSYPNIIRDAVVTWRVSPQWNISFGQSKLPGNRQRVVSSGEMQFADRSIVNRAFNIDRDTALQSQWLWRLGEVSGNLRAALSTGEGRSFINRDSGLAYTLRTELLPLGDFKEGGDYFESDLAYETSPKISIGAGISHNDRTRRSAGQLGVQLSQARTMQATFADFLLKYRGASVYLEYMRRDCEDPIVNATDDEVVLAGQGWLAQVGYFLTPKWEIAARYASVQPFNSVRAFEPMITQYTLGVTRFINGHRVKVQTDITWNEERLASRTQNWLGRFQIELGI